MIKGSILSKTYNNPKHAYVHDKSVKIYEAKTDRAERRNRQTYYYSYKL